MYDWFLDLGEHISDLYCRIFHIRHWYRKKESEYEWARFLIINCSKCNSIQTIRKPEVKD